MSIWFYIWLVTLIIALCLALKLLYFKKSLHDISQSFKTIIESDTNNLITVSTNDKILRELTTFLNASLRQVRKLRIEYENGNEEVKAAITNISHDLRTPLTAIIGYLDLITSKASLTKKDREYLEIIKSKTTDLITLTNELFDYSKGLDQGNNIHKERLCLNEVLEDVIITYYALLKEKDIVPNLDICSKKIYRNLDIEMTKRVFDNIISNAIKYGEHDLKIKLDAKGKITFSNHASDLDKVSVARIFNRYYTVQNAKKGSGVGLSIAKQFVELMGGKIKATYKDNIITISVQFEEKG